MNIDMLKVRMGRPVDISITDKHEIRVYHPVMKEIIDMGEDEFQKMVIPFILTTDAVFAGAENIDELKSKFHIYDLFFLEDEKGKTILDDNVFDGRNALEILCKSLSFFLKTDKVLPLKIRRKIGISGSYVIDKKEFGLIRKAVQAILGRGDIEVEQPPKDMSKRQRDIWIKLQKGRRRKAEKEAIYLQDTINYVQFGGRSFIPDKEIEQMTYYQLHNAYRSIIGVDSYLTGLQYKLSQKFEVKEEIKHWSESLKIGR
ncbi:AMP-binding protein (plasmid) [Bacillus velezensis]|uniref:AMP-binding protein n=1 Tax=Bacillus velezensis TaxID=492670 RepID=UPI000A9017EB|nr:AMP-binding protein [Bacillus velezensis]URJ76441.1 AMP-binding protein [Bacillus velezensis]URJ80397.1 AMP-binding protein [Bacillus velezensis]